MFRFGQKFALWFFFSFIFFFNKSHLFDWRVIVHVIILNKELDFYNKYTIVLLTCYLNNFIGDLVYLQISPWVTFTYLFFGCYFYLKFGTVQEVDLFKSYIKLLKWYFNCSKQIVTVSSSQNQHLLDKRV